jgi:serine phosphatase RsbU (regulator of sigma subunit)
MNASTPDRIRRIGIARLAEKAWPWLAQQDERDRRGGLAEFTAIVFSAPLAALGLGWLIAATDLVILRREWLSLVLALVLALLFDRLPFFQVVEFRRGVYDTYSSTLIVLVLFSTALLFGPTGLWVAVASQLIEYAHRIWRSRLIYDRWHHVRHLLFALSEYTLGLQLGLALYQALGGRFPLADLAPPTLLAVAAAIATLFGFVALLYFCFFLLIHLLQLSLYQLLDVRPLLGFFLMAMVVPAAFAALAAVLYSQLGLGAYLFLLAGALLTSLLAYRLSTAAERSHQRSLELTLLEQLGRALLAAPPDASTLPEVLATWVPRMFRSIRIDIQLISGRTLLHVPSEVPPPPQALWDWVWCCDRAQCFGAGQQLPWSGQPAPDAIAVAPIIGVEQPVPLGGIAVTLSYQVDTPAQVLPALQSLAAQIATALYRADEYAQTMALQRVRHDLAVASEIQNSFLPTQLPQVDGWQFAVKLMPARETSGDFYDLMALPDGRVALLVADVTDKGIGAALFMALSRTLLRTYAFVYPADPAAVFRAANQRILTDSDSGVFVTVFYGILDPASSQLTYCNAGHSPAYLLRAQSDAAPLRLRNTGLPLGILAEADWETKTVEVAPGGLLVLYTDGVTEALDEHDTMFGTPRLLAAVQGQSGCPAEAVQDALLAAVGRFMGAAPQYDDITVMVVTRDAD